MKTYNPYTEGNKPTKTLTAKSPINLSEYPNFSATGSIAGMKKQYYGKGALLIKKGAYIYNVSSTPDLYFHLEEKNRLEELRAELRAEGISYAETIELQSLEQYIDKHDVELREAAGLPEFKELPADDTYYIEYLNASKRHARDKVEFKTYEEAKQWGKANLENFNSDMIRIKR
jgi:hypothetical protein